MHLTFGLTRMFVKFAKFAFGIIQEIQLFGISEQLPLVRFMHPSNLVLYNTKRSDAWPVRPCNMLVIWLLADAQTVRPYIVGRNGRVPRADRQVLGYWIK